MQGSNTSGDINTEVLETLREVSELYFEHYTFVYNTIISYFFEKPVKPLIELEAGFSHLMSVFYWNKKGEFKKSKKNLDRFKAHIERLLLDLYKLCFLKFSEKVIKLLESSEADLPELLKVNSTISDNFWEARNYELQNMGAEKKEVLKEYKKRLENSLETFRQTGLLKK